MWSLYRQLHDVVYSGAYSQMSRGAYEMFPRKEWKMECLVIQKLKNIIILTLLTTGLPSIAAAANATVILSQDCEYVLLDSSEGQILMKLIEGDKPKSGDALSGSLKQRDFSKLTVQRTSEVISVWIDIVDRSGTKALMRYSQYCN